MKRAHNICLDKVFRAVNRTVNMRLSGKVNYRAWLVCCKQLCGQQTEMLTECEGLLDQTQKQTLELKRKSTISGETAPASKK